MQITFLRALDRVETFEPRREGAFLAYLRSILVNQVRDQWRHAQRKPEEEPLGESHPAESRSPLEEAIGKERLEAYEAALTSLPEDQQEVVILRVELGFTYPEISGALGIATPNAARMRVSRALVRLAEVMHDAE